jgi:hypothetical protein
VTAASVALRPGSRRHLFWVILVLSLALNLPRQPSATGLLPELFDPGTGLLRDLGEGLRT